MLLLSSHTFSTVMSFTNSVSVTLLASGVCSSWFVSSSITFGFARRVACSFFWKDGIFVQRKYFFFDYDGTLAVPRTREIPSSTQETIRRLRENGHFIALATGRLQINAVDFISSMIGIELSVLTIKPSHLP